MEPIDDYLLDQMCCAQEPYDYLERGDGEYCLGFAGVFQNDPRGHYLLINSLEPRLFYQYSLELVHLYLEYCSGAPLSEIPRPISLQIIQIVRKSGDQTYYAVNKTRWLREFQRKVRGYYAKTAPHVGKRLRQTDYLRNEDKYKN